MFTSPYPELQVAPQERARTVGRAAARANARAAERRESERRVRADAPAIFKAASHASRAADDLLAFAPECAASGVRCGGESGGACSDGLGSGDAALGGSTGSCR